MKRYIQILPLVLILITIIPVNAAYSGRHATEDERYGVPCTADYLYGRQKSIIPGKTYCVCNRYDNHRDEDTTEFLAAVQATGCYAEPIGEYRGISGTDINCFYTHYKVTAMGGGGGGGDVTIGDTNVNQPPPKGGIIKMKTPDDIIEKAMGLTYSHRQSINLKEFSPKSSSHFSIKPSQIARIKRCSSKLKGLLIGILITYIVILLSFLNIADTVIKSQHLANIVTHITKGVFTVIINLLHAYLPIITYLMKLIQTKEKPLLYKRKEGQQKPRWQIWAIARAPPN